MAKIAVVFALLVFQTIACNAFVTNEDLQLGLLSVKNEVEGFTLYLETGFPNSHHAISTLTWQCHRVAETVQNVITKLKEEIAATNGDRVFKRFWFALLEVHTSLQQIALSTDVNKVTPIKSQLISNLQLTYETLEKMVYVTYVHYPDFRLKLKMILQEFVKELSAIHNNVKMEYGGVKMQWSPKELAGKIQKLTQRLTIELETNENVLNTYLNGVGFVLKKLIPMESVGDDEIDIVLHRLTRKIRKIILVTDQAVADRGFKIIASMYLTDVASLFEQLVHYIENGSQRENGDRFIQEVMYDYQHVLQDSCKPGYE
ncbi:hypothetical protein RN001_010990 [Aquatica leii]|uniref:Apolipoprotein B n=1 Tax=Aquatica leii TaxID=1421715 RepID=A0AAN7P7G6_9COLE|nr:hypothetical protein RN001_010990 [Aquatica leii]